MSQFHGVPYKNLSVSDDSNSKILSTLLHILMSLEMGMTVKNLIVD